MPSSPEHRPKPAVSEAGGIPVIDLAPIHHLDGSLESPLPPELEDLVAQVEAACREWGFFQVINHGVQPGVVERAWAAARGFFALPPEERSRVRRDEVNPLGYYEAENTKNVRDWKEVFDMVVYEPAFIPSLAADGEDADEPIQLPNQWPQSPPGFRDSFSIPFFFNPAHYAMVKPLEELLDENNVAKYEEFN